MNSMIAFIVLGFGHHCKLSIVSLHRTLLAKRVIINIGDMISYHISTPTKLMMHGWGLGQE